VVVGLAIREPLVTVIPRLMPQKLPDWQMQLEVWRLVVFLLVIIRFYLGSALYFAEVYGQTDAARSCGKRSYFVDFLGSLLQFLLFFAWAITVAQHDRYKGEISYFTVILWAILLYDNVWYCASLFGDTKDAIRPRRDINNLTLILCLLTCVGARLAGRDQVFAEHLMFFPALFFSVKDLRGMLGRYEQLAPRVNAAGGG